MLICRNAEGVHGQRMAGNSCDSRLKATTGFGYNN